MFRAEIISGKAYSTLVRFIAVLAALCFTLITITASVHHHGERSFAPRMHHTASTVATARVTTPDSATTPSFNSSDCVLCDWLLTAATPIPALSFLIAVAFSAAVALLFAVRLAALCSRPAPRRGLRAPPLAAIA